jgi:putative DNA primase/helicase
VASAPPPDQPRLKRADVDFCHQVYTEFLAGETPRNESWEVLRQRGIDIPEIRRRAYGTSSRYHSRTLDRLWRQFGPPILEVPGFFRKCNLLWFAASYGTLVPVRDVQGRVVAIQFRPNRPSKNGSKYLWCSSRKYGGPSPGAPCHVPLGITGPAKIVRIAEGVLKSDTAFIKTGIPTIGAAGAGNWRSALETAKALGAEIIMIAYDMDASLKSAVAKAVNALATQARRDGLTVQIERWDENFKGLDDALVAGVEIKVLKGDEVDAYIAEIAGKSADEDQESLILARVHEATDDPHRLARLYLMKNHTDHLNHPDFPLIRFYRDEFFRWIDSCYRIIADKDIDAQIVNSIKKEFDDALKNDIEEAEQNEQDQDEDGNRKKKKQIKVRQVHCSLVRDVVAAVAGMCLVPARDEVPLWLDQEPPFPDAAILPCRNAIVHLPSLTQQKVPAFVAATPKFFNRHALDFDFDVNAPEPVGWLQFLKALWGTDSESIEALQTWFGYCLTPDTSLEKILFLHGPKRSGKGTIAKVLAGLIGPANVANPTLAGLATNFGLAPLIGKTLATISDARLSGRTDQAVIVERLLSLSGRDPITIDRKYKSAWTGPLSARFMILSNELPRLIDQAGAFASRLIILRMTRSFLGREDKGLFDRLVPELPGILLWAIKGWQKLHERGHFIQPASALELVHQIADLSSPVGAFIRERCDLGPHCEIQRSLLYFDWQNWCSQNGRHVTACDACDKISAGGT